MAYVIQDNNAIIHTETGEVIPLSEILNLLQDRQRAEIDMTNKQLCELGVNPKYNIIKNNGIEYQCVRIKDRYEFTKMFRVDGRSLMFDEEIKLSLGARGFIATYSSCINFPKNCVVVNNKYPTIQDLISQLGVNENKVYKILKELEEAEVIKRIKMGNQNCIYFNPFLYCGGGVVDKDTYNMFKKSRWSDKPVL